MYSFPDLEPVCCSVASWPAYRILWRQVRRSSIPMSKNFPWFVVIHTVSGFSIITEAEVDVFFEFSCFFCDPADAGNLISGSSTFSKSSLNIWKFSVHILLKPKLEDFQHDLTSVWDDRNCAVIWTFTVTVNLNSYSEEHQDHIPARVSPTPQMAYVASPLGHPLVPSIDTSELSPLCLCLVVQAGNLLQAS